MSLFFTFSIGSSNANKVKIEITGFYYGVVRLIFNKIRKTQHY